MKRILKSQKPVTADAIARLADQRKDVSRFFEGKGRMVQPMDATGTQAEPDKAARDLNANR